MDVIMPQLGETVEEGTVAAWHKKEGDKVAIDELLVEIETDKVATEVPSLVAGTLLKILVGQGETVKVGTTLAIIESGDGAGTGAGSAVSAAAAAPTASTQPAKPPTPGAQQAASVSRPSSGDRAGARLSPVVRKLVAENGLDVTRIQGTGRDGRVKRNDVLSHLQDRQGVPVTTPDVAEIVPFSALRKRIAEHMVRSKATSAHVLQAIEVDFSRRHAARSRRPGKSASKRRLLIFPSSPARWRWRCPNFRT
jgi:2-oxoglutarate dehydrogenase E2 component (dihydrolipoamide succinyltransferase)